MVLWAIINSICRDNEVIVLNLHVNCKVKTTCWMWNTKQITLVCCMSHERQYDALHVTLVRHYDAVASLCERFIHKQNFTLFHCFVCVNSRCHTYICQTRVCLVFSSSFSMIFCNISCYFPFIRISVLGEGSQCTGGEIYYNRVLDQP